MAELADALDLGSSGFFRAGSSPVTRTKLFINKASALFFLLPTAALNLIFLLIKENKKEIQIFP